jgi:RNA polymerase sigma-70 factor (ECF subfamily)
MMSTRNSLFSPAAEAADIPTLKDTRILREVIFALATGCWPSDASFRAVMERYNGPLHAAAQKLVHDHDTASDLVQYAWEQLYFTAVIRGKWFVDQSEAGLYYWLFRTVWNAGIDHLRKQVHFVTLEGEEGENEWVNQRFDDPEMALLQTELRTTIIDTMLRILSTDQFNVVALFYFNGWSIEMIGSRLEMSSNTVKSHLHRAKQRLRRAFRERHIGLADLVA